MTAEERSRGCLLGLAAGDAVGTAVEFKDRGSFPPVTGMTGGGPFDLEPGQWTDDTSMALCLATSLVECGGFDARDQMDRYLDWYRSGYMSCTGTCFDIGNTVAGSLRRYADTGDPLSGPADPMTAGNGSIMRLAPVPIYFFPDIAETIRRSEESSRTTHGAPQCLSACRLFGEVLHRALSGMSKNEILFLPFSGEFRNDRLASIALGEYRDKPAGVIRGTGYVVDSLEAALWCFFNTASFEGAILAAANLGDDADTTAAVCGQVAGAHYGMRGIPQGWLEKLTMRGEIISLADRLMNNEI
ncbi:MAG: ADP-ribosylglycohydrolase family protein [Candidatus Krumholzibacteria bacterium]|nr:ADP-ribosylglycohydrolase family protein [Candidatus Krumholzibacteria bacterium]